MLWRPEIITPHKCITTKQIRFRIVQKYLPISPRRAAQMCKRVSNTKSATPIMTCREATWWQRRIVPMSLLFETGSRTCFLKGRESTWAPKAEGRKAQETSSSFQSVSVSGCASFTCQVACYRRLYPVAQFHSARRRPSNSKVSWNTCFLHVSISHVLAPMAVNHCIPQPVT